MSQDPIPYSPDCLARLLERLRPYQLSKGEVLMILNLRPASVAALNTVIEDMADRFTEPQQEDMVNIIADLLAVPTPQTDESPDAEMEAAATT